MNMTDYDLLCSQARAFLEEEPWFGAALSNISALLWESLPDLNWAGFYLLRQGKLTLGPFQGKTACIHIPLGRGVCGTAAQRDETQVVPDVHRFPGHIACDGASNSEIVIPLHREGRVAGVLDLDSPVFDRFSEADRAGLTALAGILEAELLWPGELETGTAERHFRPEAEKNGL